MHRLQAQIRDLEAKMAKQAFVVSDESAAASSAALSTRSSAGSPAFSLPRSFSSFSWCEDRCGTMDEEWGFEFTTTRDLTPSSSAEIPLILFSEHPFSPATITNPSAAPWPSVAELTASGELLARRGLSRRLPPPAPTNSPTALFEPLAWSPSLHQDNDFSPTIGTDETDRLNQLRIYTPDADDGWKPFPSSESKNPELLPRMPAPIPALMPTTLPFAPKIPCPEPFEFFPGTLELELEDYCPELHSASIFPVQLRDFRSYVQQWLDQDQDPECEESLYWEGGSTTSGFDSGSASGYRYGFVSVSGYSDHGGDDDDDDDEDPDCGGGASLI
ncbi:hypothetical protein B0T16DRAFT_453888 [Cercophora newfieldiana]|uniref:Uncharacterized protein n=1 Tax=Cercophora newfieldiana TaxID=92897 RepID=A0AA39YH40_9PEZI|nr:hypothetical protein B0T16DRAFT_453888 [Cercophora newfieldiana]